MVVHMVLVPDSKIIEEVAGFKSVAVVGCSYCANASIAYEKNLPSHMMLVDKTTGRTTLLPVAMMEETNRLKNLLESKGLTVKVEIWPPLCALTDERELPTAMGGRQWADPALANRCADAEAVVALCCVGGMLGIKKRLGKAAKIVRGMKTVGLSQFYFTLDEAKEFIHIDKDRSTIIRAFKQ
jgi:hypothetical protein